MPETEIMAKMRRSIAWTLGKRGCGVKSKDRDECSRSEGFSCKQGGSCFRQRETAVTFEDLYAEADLTEVVGKLCGFVKVLNVGLFGAAILLADLAEADNLARQEVAPAVVIEFCHARPIRSGPETSARALLARRFGDVENQDSAG